MEQQQNKTDVLIKIYKEDPVKENLNALIHQLRKTVFFVPAMLPEDVDVEKLKEAAKGKKKAPLPKGVRPVPCLLKNKEGVSYLPMYTTQQQIPKEPKYDVLLNMPFQACYAICLKKELGVAGVALNPFTDNLLLKNELLEAIQKQDASDIGKKQVQVSPGQYQVMMRQKVEFHDLPQQLYKEGKIFIDRLCEEKEAFLNSIYALAYSDDKLYPFSREEFDVMALNISEELLLIRVDLPQIKAASQLCFRIYITFNPKDGRIHYFTIECGKDKNHIMGGIDGDGKHIEYGEAPVEGAEIQKVMDIIKGEKELTS